jgi:hypothetical protein
MKYRVTWTEFRTNSKRVLIIEAETAADAKEVAIDHIERKYGIQSYAIDTVEPYTGPAGRVVNE